MLLLLDTHAWIWTSEGDARRVGRRARGLIGEAASRGALRVSVASIFEIVALHATGRLTLSRSPEQWIEATLERGGTRVAELTREMAVDAGFIPRDALADPVDRFVVATARQLDALLLTADRSMLAYANRGNLVRIRDLRR